MLTLNAQSHFYGQYPTHIETSQVVFKANQLIGFCMKGKLVLNGLNTKQFYEWLWTYFCLLRIKIFNIEFGLVSVLICQWHLESTFITKMRLQGTQWFSGSKLPSWKLGGFLCSIKKLSWKGPPIYLSFFPFARSIPWSERIDQVISWMKLEEEKR